MSSKLTQTELATEFGISYIAMGKKLIELKLRDTKTKLATQYALDNHFAKIVNYQKGSEIVKMNVWYSNIIEHIQRKTKKDFNFCADILFGKIKELKKIEENDSGQKIDYWMFDSAHESFLKYYQNYSENLDILSLLLTKLKKENMLDFASRFEELKNLNTIVLQQNLSRKLPTKNIKERKNKI